MRRLPPPPATKRCTKCGSHGPFSITSHAGKPYYRSRCKVCEQHDRAIYRQTYKVYHPAEERRAYHRTWQQQRRLTRALAAYAAQPTRIVSNYLGRRLCPPGKKWCSYGQHTLPATLAYFWQSPRTKDGFMRNCIACRKTQHKLHRLHHSAHTFPPVAIEEEEVLFSR